MIAITNLVLRRKLARGLVLRGTCTYVRMLVCARMCVCACARVCVCVCVCVCVICVV